MLRVGLVGVFALGLLVASPRLADGALSMIHNDRVHYVGHLVAGRMLSLCPCASSLAETQYARGMYHARTPRQMALLTSGRPTSLRARIGEARQLTVIGLEHLGRHVTA